MQVENALYPSPEQAMAFFTANASGGFVMVNLLKFRAHAEYDDGSDAHLTGAEAYARYGAGVVACLAAVGGRILYSGPVTGLLIGTADEMWDAVALGYYPSAAAMQTMVASPEYQTIAHHRKAGLAGQLNIGTAPPPGL